MAAAKLEWGQNSEARDAAAREDERMKAVRC